MKRRLESSRNNLKVRLMKSNILIRETLAQEDWLIAEHFYRMWLDNQVLPEFIKTN